MSTYLERLNNLLSAKAPTQAPAKTARSPVTPPFGSFGSARGGYVLPNEDDFIERAAIAEYDGGLSRPHAEALAAIQTIERPAGISKEQMSEIIDRAAYVLDGMRLRGTDDR